MTDDAAAQQGFLRKSRERLLGQLAELNGEFETEVRRVREDVIAARALRGETPEGDGEEIKRWVAQAVRDSPKGARARVLMEQIEQVEKRIRAITARLTV